MKRVLIITYYWPPSGGAGVQRWLKFAKYLPEFGWQPVIYTPENPEIPVHDESLAKDIPKQAEIIKTKIWEPYELYKKFTGRKGQRINSSFLNDGKKTGVTDKISVWLRGNLFIPDARKFWVKPSVRYLTEYLKISPVDAIISTGPPHSMHLIAMGLKKNINVRWIADFRDPWTNIDFYPELMLTAAADRNHRKMERNVLEQADEVITVGKTMAEEFRAMAACDPVVITNGFDEDDIPKGEIAFDKYFSIAHIGTMVKTRNPENLWKALTELCSEIEGFSEHLKIKLAGKADLSVRKSITSASLDRYTEYIEYLPHDQAVILQRKTQVLLLVLNDTPNAKGILTGKFFEYMAAERPIVCIGPEDGDAAAIINETGCGEVYTFDDVSGIKEGILRYYRLFLDGNLKSKASGIQQYSRKSLTAKLTTLLQQPQNA